MHRSDLAGVRSRVFGDPSRWLITCRAGRWTVRPPVGTFWGHGSQHDSSAEALAAFRQQTSHLKG
uniref:WGR domain-containing protein n=1 Tax=Mycobacterium phage Pharb TaxID=3136626 RepID=A0AAU8GPN0_9VIRU